MNQSAEPKVSFALIGDVQFADRDPWAGRIFRESRVLLRKTIHELNAKKLDFIVSLGDLGDGLDKNEIPAILEEYAESVHPVKYVVGNHDFVKNSEEELKRLFGLDDLFYTFKAGGIEFIVLNGLDVSRFAPPGSKRYAQYEEYKIEHPWRKLREWDGMLSAESRRWLRARLEQAQKENENVILISHVPLLNDDTNAYMWDRAEILDILDEYPNVKAFFAGHYHPGGLQQRKGVLHKTVKAICNCTEPTACICHVYEDRIELEGFGEESDSEMFYEWKPVRLSGRALPGSWIVCATGELVQADGGGNFSLEVAAPGTYALKAMLDGRADAFLPQVVAPAENLQFRQEPEPGRRVVHGFTDGYALLRITDDGTPVRAFDLNGTAFGSLVKPGFWYENSENFWSRGEYVFSARGKVEIQTEPYHKSLRAKNWFKGDFHAHIIHGENFYCGNVPLYAFAARAEHYDWLYCAEAHENTRVKSDPEKWTQLLSGPDFLLRLNREFPKNGNGHVGNIGLSELHAHVAYDWEAVTNYELTLRYIASAGAVAVPVHPHYGGDGMTGKEVFLWLLCNPEMCPCLDLFYFENNPNPLAFWYMLLNRGYRIGVTATSDAAFDVGRTPGSRRGATFVHVPALTEANIVEAVKNRRTAVTTGNGGMILLSIDGEYSGAVLAPSGRRTLKCETWYRPGGRVTAEIVRCGETTVSRELVSDAEGRAEFEMEIDENENSWYLALLRDPELPGHIQAAASPVYFRNASFRKPQEYEFPRPFPRELADMLRSLSVEELMDERLFDRLIAHLTPKL